MRWGYWGVHNSGVQKEKEEENIVNTFFDFVNCCGDECE